MADALKISGLSLASHQFKPDPSRNSLWKTLSPEECEASLHVLQVQLQIASLFL